MQWKRPFFIVFGEFFDESLSIILTTKGFECPKNFDQIANYFKLFLIFGMQDPFWWKTIIN